MAKAQKTALDLIREAHGSGSVFGGNESVRYSVSATSTGSLNLDTAITCGGLPDGRLILWSGPESSGKTLGSLCFGKKKQQENKRVLFIDAECTWDHNWASMLGLKVDPEWMMVAQESSGIKIFDLLCGKPKSAKETGRKVAIPGILSEEILKQMESEGTPLGAIILDSINMVQPPLEMSMETGDQQIGSLSRFLPPVLRRITPLLKKFNIPMICICQARTNIGQMKGDPLTVSGGKALMHAASLWLDSRKIGGSDIFADGDSDGERPIGHQVRVKIRKNKVGPPGRKAELTIYYTKGIDLRPELLDQGLERGLIRHEGNSLHYSRFDGGRVVGKNNAIAAIFNDKKLAEQLLKDILNHKANSDREFKKANSDFVDENEEGVVEGDVVIKTIGTDEVAKVVSSSQVQSKIQVQPGGSKVDKRTGETVRLMLQTDDEVLSSESAEEPSEDLETNIAAVDGDEEEETIVPTAIPSLAEKSFTPSPISTATSSSVTDDVSFLPLKDLKDLGKELGIRGWYKLGTEELREAIKTAKAKS
jgi:recombination protein RecA